MQKDIKKILIDILKFEMDLPDIWGKTEEGNDIPCIWIGGQNIKTYNPDKLQISVGSYNNIMPYANNINYKNNEDGTLTEIKTINQREDIQIDIFSRNNEARQRAPEIITSLHSTYSLDQQSKYAFKIARIFPVNYVPEADGGSVINRFIYTVSIITHYTYKRIIDYYDKFPLSAQDEKEEFLNTTLEEE